MTESAVLQQGIHPVLIPCSLCISTHHACSRIDDIVPSVVLERIVELSTQCGTQILAGSSLGICPSITIGEGIAITQSFVSQLHEVLLAYHGILIDSTRCPAYRRTPCHLCLTFLTLFGRDHDDTIGTTGTIQSTGGSVLQDGHGFNIRRVDVGQRAIVRNTVHYIQRRRGSIDRTITTDDNRSRFARLARTRSRQDTRCLSFQAFRHVRNRTRLQLFITNSRGRTGKRGFLRRTVGNHHHLIQHLRVGLHSDRHIRLNINFFRVHTHEGYYDSSRGTWYVRQGELTIHVSNCTLLGTFYLY